MSVLEAEKRVLANAEKIYNAAMNAFDLLYEGNSSTASSLRAAQKQVEELASYEPKFQEAFAALETARISVEDVGATVRDYAGGIQASPEHLAQVADRLATLDRLKRKYGPTLDDVIAFGADVSRKLAEVENKDEILGQLRKELAAAAAEYLRAARALSKKRSEAARRLEKLVEAEINDLAMKVCLPHRDNEFRRRSRLVRFRVRSARLPDLYQSGRTDAADGAHRLRRRVVAGDARAQSQRRGWKSPSRKSGEKRGDAENFGL